MQDRTSLFIGVFMGTFLSGWFGDESTDTLCFKLIAGCAFMLVIELSILNNKIKT